MKHEHLTSKHQSVEQLVSSLQNDLTSARTELKTKGSEVETLRDELVRVRNALMDEVRAPVCNTRARTHTHLVLACTCVLEPTARLPYAHLPYSAANMSTHRVFSGSSSIYIILATFLKPSKSADRHAKKK
jgi:hypothetical protein